MLNRRKTGILLLILVIILLSGVSSAVEPKRVAIIPFKINSDRDLSFLRDGIGDMLSSRLSWKDRVIVLEKEAVQDALSSVSASINEKLATEIGNSLHADYVVFGSLTVFGNSVSLDATIVDVSGKKPPITIFNQSHGMDEVIPKINEFAMEINRKVFGRILVSKKVSNQPSSSRNIYVHPDRLIDESATNSELSEVNPSFVVTPPKKRAGGLFWKSRKFKTYIKGMALGDVDGDKKTEIVFISENRIYIYRNTKRRLSKIREISGGTYDSFISVDVADINGNEKAEIFVTNLHKRQNTLSSFVLEWNGSDFIPICKDEKWYYRTIDIPARGQVLFGQRRGIPDVFLPGVYELAWRSGRGYEPVEKVKLPPDLNVYSFNLGDIMNKGEEMIVAFDEADYLKIFNRSGSEEEWKSDKYYGGSLNYLEQKPNMTSHESKYIYIPQRIFIKDIDNDGKNEVIIVKNYYGTGSRLFTRFRKFTSSEIQSLSWDGLGLALNWKTRKIHGYVSDYAIADFDNDGKEELIATVVTKTSSIFSKGNSSIISYDLFEPQRNKV